MWSVFHEASTYLYFALYFSRLLSCKNLNVAGDLFRERNGGKEREREGGREREKRDGEEGEEREGGGKKRERENVCYSTCRVGRIRTRVAASVGVIPITPTCPPNHPTPSHY